MKKIMIFQFLRKNLKKIAQSQLNFALSHNNETVTFRNSVQVLIV